MISRRPFAVLLTALVVALFWTSASTDVSAGGRPGTYLTPNGYRTPLFGMSHVRSAAGASGTSCVRLTSEHIAAARFGRRVSRAMQASSPHAVVKGVGATFEIIYSDPIGAGFNDSLQGATRRRALEAAVAAWTKVIQGSITIKVTASMEDIDDGDDDETTELLAAAGPVDFWVFDDTAIPSALAWQLSDRRDNGGDADIEVTVNEAADWDYATNGVAAGGKASFVYALIHEIGHGLGFVDSFDIETGEIANTMPFVYDTFVNRGSRSRRAVIDRPGNRAIDDLQSDDLFFNGEHAIEASGRSIRPLPMVKLYAPDPYEPGSSISHVDQVTYADFKTGLMTPTDFGSGTDKIDILTLAIMQDLGYQLVPQAVTARTPQ
jgi:hypothetical protein